MNSLHKAAATLALLICAAFSTPPSALAERLHGGYAPNTIVGAWDGVYYDCVACGGAVRFTFDAWLPATGDAFLAESAEPNTFAASSAPELFANWEIEVRGGRLFMRKTYDGAGGQTHTVVYIGEIVGPNRIVGRWSVGDASGDFVLERRDGPTS